MEKSIAVLDFTVLEEIREWARDFLEEGGRKKIFVRESFFLEECSLLIRDLEEQSTVDSG